MMKYTVLATLFSLFTVVLVFYAMIYPAWFEQNYKNSDPNVYQGFGLWEFLSTGQIDSPFYASVTSRKYSYLCQLSVIELPNWMLGSKTAYQDVMCSTELSVVQVLVAISAALSSLNLIASIGAVFRARAGLFERAVSILTLIGGLLLAVALVVWGWLIQRKLYEVDQINTQYQTCKSSSASWTCWFYGRCFWIALAAVVSFSIAGYFSSAGRNEKARFFHKEYDRNLQMAVQASLQDNNASVLSTQAPVYGQPVNAPPGYEQGYPAPQPYYGAGYTGNSSGSLNLDQTSNYSRMESSNSLQANQPNAAGNSRNVV